MLRTDLVDTIRRGKTASSGATLREIVSTPPAPAKISHTIRKYDAPHGLAETKLLSRKAAWLYKHGGYCPVPERF